MQYFDEELRKLFAGFLYNVYLHVPNLGPTEISLQFSLLCCSLLWVLSMVVRVVVRMKFKHPLQSLLHYALHKAFALFSVNHQLSSARVVSFALLQEKD